MTYAGENKQIAVWAGLWKFWKQVVDVALREHLEPLLRIEPTNADKAGYPNMHIITEERHAELLAYEKQVLSRRVGGAGPMTVGMEPEPIVQPRPAVRSYSKQDQTRRSPGKKR